MNKIMAALDKKFSGQALARLDTYAGKMDLLKVAAANATEIIGKGLIDALTVLGKDNSIDQAANSMNGFANAVANTAKGMGELIAQVKQIIDSDVGKFLLAITALLTLGKKQLIVGAAGLIAYDIGKSNAPGKPNVGGYSGIPDIRTAQALLTKKHMSCFAGHQQGRQIAYGNRADGHEMTAIICGSCYEHDEGYLGPQGNNGHFRGAYMLYDVEDGRFDELPLTLKYLKNRYA
jgi:hypothetical protein